MKPKTSFSSVRLMLTLFICATSVMLLYNLYSVSNSGFFSDSFGALSGFAIVLIFFVPSVIIKKRTNLDFISFAKLTTPSAVIFTSSYYGLYFVYAAASILIRYSDMFHKVLNPDANIFVVSLILLAVCVYAALKGVNALSRVALFVFAFSLLAFILILCGNIANLNFENNSFDFKITYDEMTQGTAFFASISFIAVIFGFNSEKAKKFRFRQAVITLTAAFAVAALFLFFIYFALGSYGKQQPYQLYTLSKASHLGVAGGVDSLYLAAVTAGVFVLISALLISFKSSVEENGNRLALLFFTLIVYILFICAENFNAIKEILTDLTVFNALNFISAVLIPTIYITIFRRRLNA